LPHFSRKLQFEQGCENLGRRHGRLEPLYDFINLGGFVCLEQGQNLALMRAQRIVVAWE
jgi:hypothetical protein